MTVWSVAGTGHRMLRRLRKRVPRAGHRACPIARAGWAIPHSARIAMEISLDLLGNAVVAGLLLGGFYAAVTIGVSISFGMLDIVNIAHPAFIILGSYIAYFAQQHASASIRSWPAILVLPAFYAARRGGLPGLLRRFERRGDESLRGLAFFFGLLFITEVALILVFGVDYRWSRRPISAPALHFGTDRPAAADAGAVPGRRWR